MGRRYNEAKKQVEGKPYELLEGLHLLKKISYVKFDETVDMAVRLGVDPKHSDQIVRGAVVLPNGTGKKEKILVFAKGEKEKEAIESGADYVGVEDMVDKISKGWMDFDRVVSTPDLMGIVGRLGRILGPRGLMPNPKTGTVTFDIARAIKEIRQGRVEYRVDKTGIVHAPVGKVSFEAEKLNENILTVLESIVRAKPAASKGRYIRDISLSSTMGPGINIDTSLAVNLSGSV
ncbi:MAG: 50S ribosomal protein L1 [Nitrospirota bacterium]